jgi:hypothetical protein
MPFEYLSTLAFGPAAVRAEAWRGVGGMDESLTPEPGECGIYADADLALRLWANEWRVAHVQPVFELGAMEGGGSHGVSQLACFTRQAHLNRHAVLRRFPESFGERLAATVASLNAGLTKRFEGEAPWEATPERGGLGFDWAPRNESAVD